jgi:hypothetical protein
MTLAPMADILPSSSQVRDGSIATGMARPRRVRFCPDSGLNGRNADPSGRGLSAVRGGLPCHKLSARNPGNKPAQMRMILIEKCRFCSFSRPSPALVTVWLQVRVLPGPPCFALRATRGAAAPKPTAEASCAAPRAMARNAYPPVADICRESAGGASFRSITKSCPRGLSRIA